MRPPLWGLRATADRGMTLIEVMVALTIVAIALIAGIQASRALINNTERLSDAIASEWCADNQLNELRLTRQFPAVGDTEFACEQMGRAYKGHMVVRPTPNPNFRRVDARVLRDDGQMVLMLSTILPRN